VGRALAIGLGATLQGEPLDREADEHLADDASVGAGVLNKRECNVTI